MQYPNQPNQDPYAPPSPYAPPPPPTERNSSGYYGVGQTSFYSPANYNIPEDRPNNNRLTIWIAIAMIFTIVIIAVAAVLVVLAPVGQSSTAGEWKAFKQPTGKFIVDFPGSPKENTTSQYTLAGTVTIYFYNMSTNNGDMFYQLGWNDFPADLIQAAPDKWKLLDGAVSGGVSAMNGKKLSEKDLTIYGYPGKEIQVSVTSPQKGDFTIRIFLVNNRLYQMMAGGTTGKIDQNGLNRFMNSFRITG